MKVRHIKRHLFGYVGCTNAVRNPTHVPFAYRRFHP